MARSRRNAILVVWVLIGIFPFLQAWNAGAVPSFARQTGMSCDVCHTAFPELTPFGRHFKLTGYSMSQSEKPYQFPPPLAGMLQLSFTRTDKRQPRGSVDDNWATHVTSSDNNMINVPQQASVFYAPDPVDGSRTGSPNSNGFILELDYLRLEITKFLSLKASLQYTVYTKFNGSHSNYDAFGRDASDNNTLYFLIWLML
jgi:hypothetical protein